MPDLDELNGLSRDGFAAHLDGVFEHSPWVAEAAWERRPFTGLAQLHAACMAAVFAAGRERQLALIRAHPDLAGKAALAGELTEASVREQAGAGLDRLGPERFARFHRLNDAYKAKFTFPFIICVRRHDQQSILAAFEHRLESEMAAEIHMALTEIGEIVRLRLRDLMPEAGNERRPMKGGP
jgi:2-oxo-4-hydroxy-4-carboxy-5-ureidoimidazoline decarboxylase